MSASEPYGLLLDQAQDKVALLSVDGEYTYVNAAAEEILGFEPDELVGTNAFGYIHPDERERVRRTFEEAVEAAEFTEVTAEYRHRAEDGSWVWLE
ncbi:PAS domain S-box protein, partial [Halorubrum sp. SS5]